MTYDILKADELYAKHSKSHDNFDHYLVTQWREKMPDGFARVMYEEEYGCHIYDLEMYSLAVSCLINRDKSKGPHWTLDTIKAKSGIDFDSKDYTCYDYAYVVNMLFSDYGDVFTEPGYYLKMARNYLTDEDYFGDASERAYHDAKYRIDYYEDR